MRLLLVENDPLLGDGVEARLKQAGFAVDWAKDGREAQLALETTEYELIVLDLGLPRVSGLDLLRWIEHRQSKGERLRSRRAGGGIRTSLVSRLVPLLH